jgi:anti-sigma regulatory factor (Ser/Thr protein kinase)
MDPSWSYQQTWPPAAQSVAPARDFVAASMQAHFDPDLVDDARLVVSELATNAIRHAGTAFTVTVACHDGDVRIDVRDGSALEPVMSLRSATAVHGRGLLLVHSLSTAWGVTTDSDGGKSVWATLGAS